MKAPKVAGIVSDVETSTQGVIFFETPAWTALLEWLAFHGVDGHDVPAGTVVVRDAAGRCIRYVRMVRGEDGQPRYWSADGENLRPFHEAAIEQGEAPPTPFPTVITEQLEPVR